MSRPTLSVPLRALATGAALLGSAPVLSACGGPSQDAAPDAASISVAASDKACTLSNATLPAGRHTIAVHNGGSGVTEIYVYAAKDRSMGEVENVGPGTSRNLVVDLEPGTYAVACKPGMTGTGVRSALTVTGSAIEQTQDPQLDKAVAGYRSYVEEQTAALLATTVPLVAAVKAGEATKARALYAAARLRYESIEPIAESFGELDPLIDMRADDITAETPFVGFHKLELDLFKTKDIRGSGPVADDLLTNVRKLAALLPTVDITPLTMANGAKSLLDEVAKSKVTGEEERYSRLDLVDFAGNVDGARAVVAQLRPVLVARDPALVATLDKRFTALQTLLATHAQGSGYVRYGSLTKDQVKALAVEVDALSEPLGAISAAIT